MSITSLVARFDQTREKHPHLTQENFYRILLLYYGIADGEKNSYVDAFHHVELIFTAQKLSPIPVLTFLRPTSPFSIENGNTGEMLLFFQGDYVDTILDYEERLFDFRREEPFYFYVREINGDLVLKLNPIQLCDFFQNPRGMLPCSFCFRNDMVQRFRNISAKDLVRKILEEEEKKDGLATLRSIDEISIVTGSYKSDDHYVDEISTLVQGIKQKISPGLRVVVGSHEGKADIFQSLKDVGVTTFAFPFESMDDSVRQKEMKNRKGVRLTEDILKDVEKAHMIFGDDGTIIRLIAGMGDTLNASWEEKVHILSSMGDSGPLWNINQYMPFTHYHWKLFQNSPPYDLNYMFAYMNRINKLIPQKRQMRFKVSP